MTLKALLYAYVLGGLTFIPLLIAAAIAWTIYTSVPVGDPDPAKLERKKLSEEQSTDDDTEATANALPKPRKGWLTVRRTFEESESDGSYMNMMRTFLDARSKDPKRSRPKDMWYVVLKGNVLYLYEDETMTECEAAIQVTAHEVVVYPEGLQDGELFTKRNAICLKPLEPPGQGLGSVTKEMGFEREDVDKEVEEMDAGESKKAKERAHLEEIERGKAEAKAQAFDRTVPWFIFVRSCIEMEDWFLALVHASKYHKLSTLEPVEPVFRTSDMDHLVSTLDAQPDVIPMRWLNALIGRIFFSFYRTQHLESAIIGRLTKKLSKVKMPTFLQNVSVTEVSVGDSPPSFLKPMLKDLTKEGDAALEIHVSYKGEIRLTVEATAIINLGQRFKTYSVKLVLAVVLRKLEGNLLIKVKRPPSNRIWYAFTHTPEMDIEVEPLVSDRQIKWSMICSTIQSKLKEIINESVVLPNMDDIAFFESAQYTHRGGIWGDATRKVFQGEGSKSETGETEEPAQNSLKSKSTDGLLSSPSGLSGESSSEVENQPSTTEESAASAPILGSDASKRQSWFSGSLAKGPSSLTMEMSGSGSTKDVDDNDERGRTLSAEATPKRATSVPASKSSPIVSTNLAESESAIESEVAGKEDEVGDPSTSHSRVRSLSSGAHTLQAEASSSRESLASKSSAAGSNSNNTSTFLSALKSKDKQVLSNTAKEAMRKWSANWNGFKRERMGTQSTTNGNDEDLPDGAPPNSASPSIFSFSNKSRNYADIRAAVVGRRTKDGHDDEMHSRSSPIDIPQGRREDVDAPSTSSERRSSSSPHSSSPKGPSLLRKEANRASILPPKVTTETQSIESLASTPAAFVPQEPAVTSPPIRTQPSQGAMMTIPSIHASHRGEVQSYGYVPPQPSQPATPEGKTRTPTIQDMVKLFRAPSSSASTSSLSQQQLHDSQRSSSPAEAEGVTPRANSPAHSSVAENGTTMSEPSLPSSGATEAVRSSPPTTNGIPKANPPPLPPRTRTISQPRFSLPSSAQLSPSADGTAPSASDTLKLIADADETKRKDLRKDVSPERGRPSPHPSSPNTVSGTTPVKKKRTSLGARRISPAAVLSEEPDSLLSHSPSPPFEVPDAVPEDTAVSQMTGVEPSVVAMKLAPPPLPPRKISS